MVFMNSSMQQYTFYIKWWIIFKTKPFFLWIFQISYSRNTSMILHRIPIVIFIAVPFFLRFLNPGLRSSFATTYDFVKGSIIFFFMFVCGDTYIIKRHFCNCNGVYYSICRFCRNSASCYWGCAGNYRPSFFFYHKIALL